MRAPATCTVRDSVANGTCRRSPQAMAMRTCRRGPEAMARWGRKGAREGGKGKEKGKRGPNSQSKVRTGGSGRHGAPCGCWKCTVFECELPSRHWFFRILIFLKKSVVFGRESCEDSELPGIHGSFLDKNLSYFCLCFPSCDRTHVLYTIYPVERAKKKQKPKKGKNSAFTFRKDSDYPPKSLQSAGLT